MLSEILRNIARRHLAAEGDQPEWGLADGQSHQGTYVPRSPEPLASGSPDAPPAPTGSASGRRQPAGEAARARAARARGEEVESREWRVENENASSPLLSTLGSPLSTSFPGLQSHQGTYVPRSPEQFASGSPDAPPAPAGTASGRRQPAGEAVRANAAPAAGEELSSREWRMESDDPASPLLSTHYSPLSTSFPGLHSHQGTYVPCSPEQLAPGSPEQLAPNSPHDLAGRVEEGSRQVAQTIGDLEASLARLFETQIDALERLSERALEQERRWVALAALRRSTP